MGTTAFARVAHRRRFLCLYCSLIATSDWVVSSISISGASARYSGSLTHLGLDRGEDRYDLMALATSTLNVYAPSRSRWVASMKTDRSYPDSRPSITNRFE